MYCTTLYSCTYVLACNCQCHAAACGWQRASPPPVRLPALPAVSTPTLATAGCAQQAGCSKKARPRSDCRAIAKWPQREEGRGGASKGGGASSGQRADTWQPQRQRFMCRWCSVPEYSASRMSCPKEAASPHGVAAGVRSTEGAGAVGAGADEVHERSGTELGSRSWIEFAERDRTACRISRAC